MNLLTYLHQAFEFDLTLPPGWMKGALVLSFFGTGVVIAVFGYLNRYTKKPYFHLWTSSWAFYAAWLAASIFLVDEPGNELLLMVRRACAGCAAVCMFWGTFEMTGSCRTRRELGFAMILIIVWSYLATYQLSERLWAATPMAVLLGGASIFTGSLYFKLRRRYSGAGMLAVGFILFGLHLISQPYLERSSPMLLAASYLVSSLLALFIALAMVVQVLEQGREQNETLLEEFKRGMNKRRMLEQEIIFSETKYRALFDAATDAIFLVDLESLEILEANQAAAKFLGDNPTSCVGRSFLEVCPALYSPGGTLLEQKRIFDEVIGLSKEFPMRRFNGTTVPCEGTNNLVQYNKRPVLQINIRETTERKQLEEQLRQAEKLSALGQLVAGVAHELNNPLAIIMGYAQLLTKPGASEAKVKSDVVKILHESERAAKIIRNLLTFARPRDPQMISVDLNRLIAGSLEAHESEFAAAAIELTTQLAPDLPSTVADPHQMEQVFTNLIVNAFHALQNLGGQRRIRVTTAQHKQTIRFSVADNGPGIAPEILGKIFDPFFTTKPPGKGTGLGLSISHSIIHEHRGRIWVQSEVGKGARFIVELPLIARTAPTNSVEAPPVVVVVRDPQAATQRLLLVDDEPGILEVLATVLGEGGYLIDTANNGNEALDRLSKRRYDLIISDLCMPGVDGETLYRRVLDTDPELAGRMIFVTGDTVSSKSRTFLESTGNRWFSKPFNIGEIEEVVHNFLAGDASLVATHDT